MPDTPAVSLLHTWQLEAARLAVIRRMLDDAYEGEFADADWEHTLGGVHALVWEGGEPIAHGSVVQRRLLYTPPESTASARALRGGYIEGVAVRADRRRRGLGRAVMAALGDVARGAYALGALSASDEGRALYESLGWRHWRGRTFAMTPTGTVRTEAEDAGIFVLPVEPLDLGGDLTCDWRDGDVW